MGFEILQLNDDCTSSYVIAHQEKLDLKVAFLSQWNLLVKLSRCISSAMDIYTTILLHLAIIIKPQNCDIEVQKPHSVLRVSP